MEMKIHEIKNMSKIECIKLSDNFISDKGVMKIFKIFEKRQTSLDVILNRN